MSTTSVASHGHAEAHSSMSPGDFVRTYVFSLDHKIIGLQFLFSTLLWFLVGGLLALGIRWQLAWPWECIDVSKLPTHFQNVVRPHRPSKPQRLRIVGSTSRTSRLKTQKVITYSFPTPSWPLPLALRLSALDLHRFLGRVT